MLNRREFFKTAAGGLLLVGTGPLLQRIAFAATAPPGPGELPGGTLESALLEALPGKLPLIKRTFLILFHVE